MEIRRELNEEEGLPARRDAVSRRLPVGAEPLPEGGVHFRVWAPSRRRVRVVLEDAALAESLKEYELRAEEHGYFSASVLEACPGSLYRFRLDGEASLYADPASRFQPQGPFGPSQVIDPENFPWTDQAWGGLGAEGQVIYEMHIGTFTQEGTWQAAAAQLPELAELGITVLEVMPVADFPGRFGWGYDGVNLFAPTRLYGHPDDFRQFLNQAHEVGIGVILDVVYNHLGPDGNFLGMFSPDYFSQQYECEWGDAINFDGPNAAQVREFFLSNVEYWIKEFHIDGLRIDATQQIFDSSPKHILAEIAERARRAAAPREVLLIGENEPQKVRLIKPLEQGGYGMDALWNDDFHHSAMVAMTGRADAYYSDYRGSPQELISALKYGWLYQGQWYSWQDQPRGTPCLQLAPWKFVNFIQNHDQLANSGSGKRCHRLTSPSRYRALTAVFLLAPQTPMLFQGQEFAANSPFFYFADHKDELAHQVAQGRMQFLSQFRTLATPEMQARLPDPSDPMTFVRCKLDFSDRYVHAEEYALHRDLLRLRREDRTLKRPRGGGLDGAILGPEAFVLRFFGDDGDDRLLLVNLGRDLAVDPAPEPLLAPPEGANWTILWSSEDPQYGGWGMPPIEPHGNWHLQGEMAILMQPVWSERP